jgi:ribosomal protein L37E
MSCHTWQPLLSVGQHPTHTISSCTRHPSPAFHPRKKSCASVSTHSRITALRPRSARSSQLSQLLARHGPLRSAGETELTASAHSCCRHYVTNVPLVSSTCLYDHCVLAVRGLHTHLRAMCVPPVPALSRLPPSKSRDLTHPLSYPTVSYERELHRLVSCMIYTVSVSDYNKYGKISSFQEALAALRTRTEPEMPGPKSQRHAA